MIRLKSRRTCEQKGFDSTAEICAEPSHTAMAADETTQDATPANQSPDQTAHTKTNVGETGAGLDGADHDEQQVNPRRRIPWTRVIAYGLLPGLALLLASAAGFLKWQDASMRDTALARTQSVQAATEGTIALLSYQPDTVQKNLEAAQARLTGTFLKAYTSLTHDVVIPGAKQKHISAAATVPGAAPTSASANHAVVLVFVNQTVIIGHDPPTNTASSVQVTLDKIGGRWLISGFDPV